MAQDVEASAARPGLLSSSPWPHVVEGKKEQLLKGVLWPPQVYHGLQLIN